jgi:hypothetical protein
MSSEATRVVSQGDGYTFRWLHGPGGAPLRIVRGGRSVFTGTQASPIFSRQAFTSGVKSSGIVS